MVFDEGDPLQVREQGIVHKRVAASAPDQPGSRPGGREDLRLPDLEAEGKELLAHRPAGLPGRVGDVAQGEAGSREPLHGFASALDGLPPDVERPVQVQQQPFDAHADMIAGEGGGDHLPFPASGGATAHGKDRRWCYEDEVLV